jgi:hypothetical protein
MRCRPRAPDERRVHAALAQGHGHRVDRFPIARLRYTKAARRWPLCWRPQPAFPPVRPAPAVAARRRPPGLTEPGAVPDPDVLYRADAGGDGVPDRAPLRESSLGGVYETLLRGAWPRICKIPVEGSACGQWPCRVSRSSRVKVRRSGAGGRLRLHARGTRNCRYRSCASARLLRGAAQIDRRADPGRVADQSRRGDIVLPAARHSERWLGRLAGRELSRRRCTRGGAGPSIARRSVPWERRPAVRT